MGHLGHILGVWTTSKDSSEPINKENIENNQDNEKNIEQSNTEFKNDNEPEKIEADMSALSENVSQLSQVSQLDKNVNDNSDQPSDCDLRTKDTADRYRADGR